VLLGKADKIDGIFFAHPKDMQDGKVKIPKGAVVANLPYHPDCGLWFDHHVSEEATAEKLGDKLKGRFALAPSAARLVYDYYGGEAKFPEYAELLNITDRVDSAQLTLEDVTHPQGYILLAYTVDPRSGLQGYQSYFLRMVELLKEQSLEKIMEDPEVKTRCETILAEDTRFRRALLINSKQDENVVITDFRGLGEVPPGNRFLIYALFPTANVSARLFDGLGGRTWVVSLGHSIFNRTCPVNLGELLSQYGGGGHAGAGTAQLPKAGADAKIAEIIAALKAGG
jgi:hypothetical protein